MGGSLASREQVAQQRPSLKSGVELMTIDFSVVDGKQNLPELA